MCGRAGWRGIDAEGSSYIFIPTPDCMPDIQNLKAMLDSKGETL